jgi:hypothetical protein
MVLKLILDVVILEKPVMVAGDEPAMDLTFERVTIDPTPEPEIASVPVGEPMFVIVSVLNPLDILVPASLYI